ncbi:YjzC family protein [Alteribacillus iranensis]|uniref:YjzC-like protein n=1 Tax=Alteribacillus iranensis TaxID=930128 RepID=A0A1I2BRI8_9BACI|nr:YjzC family protein [Alteribacillus iranensis]SFE58714.1 hypothetical protein SAMN05192532_102465 [Alteribacillus iranensis]
MAQNRFKTGEEAPQSGKYEVSELVNEGTPEENTTIDLEKGERFPPDPSSNDAAYWVKAS